MSLGVTNVMTNTDKKRIAAGLLSIIIVLGSIIALIWAKTFYPDNTVINWVWKALFLSVPLIIFFGFLLAEKQVKRKELNNAEDR
jgi:O-antigen/teichoic acid export membrane protein